jgi:dienelactone hydrolase
VRTFHRFIAPPSGTSTCAGSSSDFDAAKADYRVIEYPGAVHAFTNPEATELGKKFNLPLRYDAKVDQEAKAEAAKFFAADLQK